MSRSSHILRVPFWGYKQNSFAGQNYGIHLANRYFEKAVKFLFRKTLDLKQNQ